MALINKNVTRPVRQAAVADGTANGVIYVTDPSAFPIGALVQIGNNAITVDAKVIDIVAPNGLLVNVQGASGSLAAYTVGTSAFVSMAPQMVLVQDASVGGLMPGKAVVVTLLAGNATQTVVGGVQYRVVTDTACNISIGAAAATANDTPIVPNVPEVLTFGPTGANPTLNAFAAGAGKLFLTPMVAV